MEDFMSKKITQKINAIKQTWINYFFTMGEVKNKLHYILLFISLHKKNQYHNYCKQMNSSNKILVLEYYTHTLKCFIGAWLYTCALTVKSSMSILALRCISAGIAGTLVNLDLTMHSWRCGKSLAIKCMWSF